MNHYSALKKGIFLIPALLFDCPEVLPYASDKTELFADIFTKKSNLIWTAASKKLDKLSMGKALVAKSK